MRLFTALVVLLAAACLPAWAAPPGTARVHRTARDSSERLADVGTVSFQAMPQPQESQAAVIVDPRRTFQALEGIGGALTDASAETFFRLPAARQEELLDAYFDRDKGIGYTLARTHINSCDFSSASYAYAEPGDTALATFSVAPDEKARIPFLLRVLQRQPNLKIFASPWSPPAWMKTNGNMLQGGKLKPEFRDAWARYYVRFVKEYRKRGVPIWGLTVQNEPMAVQTWESCIYTGEEERDFVKGFLGPALHEAGMADLRLMVWDHNRGLMYQRAAAVLEDPDAARFVWGTAFHWYVGDQFDNVARVREAFPDKHLLFSEGCNYPFSWDTFEEWKWGENYGRSMIHDFNNGACGWTDWNVLLDEQGGPNHVANYCFAPIHMDADHRLRYMNSYYYIGHFSKFLRPDARRVACTTTTDDLLATAFKNPDGTVVTVVMNEKDTAKDVAVWTDGKAVVVPMPAHSILTVGWGPH